MPATQSDLYKDGNLYYNKTNTSFSGIDVIPVFMIPSDSGATPIAHVFGEIQTLSVSIHREKHPIRPLGRKSPAGFARGGRTIAGTIVFSIFDRTLVYTLMRDYALKGLLADEMPPFNITLLINTEYGTKASLSIYGVELVDAGMVLSINDVLTEQQISFLAMDIDDLAPIEPRITGGTEIVPA